MHNHLGIGGDLGAQRPERLGQLGAGRVDAGLLANLVRVPAPHRVRALAGRVNARFGKGGWEPIRLKVQHHEPPIVNEYYRAADVCVVTSLHDGMNLVAKEFVATRRDELGVLILSCFTGAARELQDALQVNPYDIDQTAEAIRVALEMSAEEKQERMQRMRKLVRENNVYRWAATLIGELCDVRLENADGNTQRFRAGASVA